MIKDIVRKLKTSATLQINEETKRLQDLGKKVYKFGFGQSPFPVPKIVKNELINNGVPSSEVIDMQQRYRAHLIYPFEAMIVTLAVGGMMNLEHNHELRDIVLQT